MTFTASGGRRPNLDGTRRCGAVDITDAFKLLYGFADFRRGIRVSRSGFRRASGELKRDVRGAARRDRSNAATPSFPPLCGVQLPYAREARWSLHELRSHGDVFHARHDSPCVRRLQPHGEFGLGSLHRHWHSFNEPRPLPSHEGRQTESLLAAPLVGVGQANRARSPPAVPYQPTRL